MKTGRRGFIGALLSLPLVSRLKAEPKSQDFDGYTVRMPDENFDRKLVRLTESPVVMAKVKGLTQVGDLLFTTDDGKLSPYESGEMFSKRIAVAIALQAGDGERFAKVVLR